MKRALAARSRDRHLGRGFDVLYACQDLAFDRAHGPAVDPGSFGVARSLVISRAMHVVAVASPRWRR